MKKVVFFSVVALLALPITGLYAGVKDDFVAAVKQQCGVDDGTASQLATPGRTGNVAKYMTCTQESIKVGDCTLKCKKVDL